MESRAKGKKVRRDSFFDASCLHGLLISLLALAGCAAPQPDTTPDGQTMGLTPGFSQGNPAFQPGPLWLLPPETPAGGGDPYTVTVSRTPFYSFGPVQTQGPDFLMEKGDPVTMIKREYGFSRVRTLKGMEGYIATDRLAPMPSPAPEAVPARTHLLKRQPPEPLKIVPLDQMLSPVEPPLPSGGGAAPLKL